jgi:hypothetical protein
LPMNRRTGAGCSIESRSGTDGLLSVRWFSDETIREMGEGNGTGARRCKLGGGLSVALVLWVCIGPMAGASTLRSQAHPDELTFRPVLCIVPPYNNSVRPPATGRLSSSSCSPESLLSPTNLGTTPSSNTQGYTVNRVPLDSRLIGTPSTKSSRDAASATVLLPGLSDAGSNNRYLLGPVQMSGAAVAKAVVQYQESDKEWVVALTMTNRGKLLWDKVACTDFDRELAIVVNGTVVSSPLIQPSQSSCTSFGGYASIAGSGIGHGEALNIARAITNK